MTDKHPARTASCHREPRDLTHEYPSVIAESEGRGHGPSSSSSASTRAATVAASASSLSMDEGVIEGGDESEGYTYGGSYTSGDEDDEEEQQRDINLGSALSKSRRCYDGGAQIYYRRRDYEDDGSIELMDLPDHALANAFFSGYLDSIEVVRSLRLVSKRTMIVGSDSCKVRGSVDLTFPG